MVLMSFLRAVVVVNRRGERRQSFVPKAVEVAAHGHDPASVELVDPARPLGVIPHEARVLQDAQMLRHGRTAYRELARQLPDRPRAFGDEFEDRAAGGVTQCVESLLVSGH